MRNSLDILISQEEKPMVKIITDTTSGLPRHLAEEYDIPILPQIIIFGEEAYRDDTELDTPTFLEKLRAAPDLSKTAAPPPDLYIPLFERLVAEGHTIICLHPSAELSGTVRSATVAARDFPDADIRVVDTRTVAGPLAAMAFWPLGGCARAPTLTPSWPVCTT